MAKSAKKSIESIEEKKIRVSEINKILSKTYPDAKCSLEHISVFELLIATILAAQCTDVKVNEITPALFKKYPTVKSFAEADISELETDIKSTGFFHNKAKSIKNCSIKILEKFNGQVPDNMEDLTSLPGVGRKTANVILGNYYHKPSVIVDTHVLRISERLGLTKENDPNKVEIDIMNILNKSKWTNFCNCIVFHGRACCIARKPNCLRCPIEKLCPYDNKMFK